MKAYAPIAIAGAVSIGIGLRDKSWDTEETTSLIASFALMAVVSLAGATRFSPVVNGIAILFMIAVIMRAVGKASSNASIKKTSRNARRK